MNHNIHPTYQSNGQHNQIAPQKAINAQYTKIKMDGENERIDMQPLRRTEMSPNANDIMQRPLKMQETIKSKGVVVDTTHSYWAPPAQVVAKV